jgi:hypothetical protein
MRRGNDEIIRRSPGFSDTTRREGAPTVPSIPTSSLFPVPAACTTRRRAICMLPRIFSFLTPPEGSIDNKAA